MSAPLFANRVRARSQILHQIAEDAVRAGPVKKFNKRWRSFLDLSETINDLTTKSSSHSALPSENTPVDPVKRVTLERDKWRQKAHELAMKCAALEEKLAQAEEELKKLKLAPKSETSLEGNKPNSEDSIVCTEEICQACEVPEQQE